MKQKNTDTKTTRINHNASDLKDGGMCCGTGLFDRHILFGTIILIIGLGLLFKNMFGWSFNYFWPLTIIVIGLYIIFKRRKHE